MARVVAEQASDLRLNQRGEAMFKIVAPSYQGAPDWVLAIRDLTRAENRGELLDPGENQGWRMVGFDFLLAGITVQGHPTRFYLYGHEGLGFTGQPGRAKDVVYRGASAIVALANDDDAEDLAAVVAADVARLRSEGGLARCFVAASPPRELPSLPPALASAGQIPADWREQPLDALKPVVRAIVRGL